jgi:hypothetical protein
MNRHVGRGVIILVILAIGFLMSGCASKPQQINISAKPIEKPKLIIPQADVLDLKEVEWIVITEKNVNDVWQRLSDDKKDIVLFGLTDDGYEQLSLNISDIMGHIQQQKAIILAYKNYYEQSEQAIDEANQNQNAINEQIDKVNEDQTTKPWWDITQ